MIRRLLTVLTISLSLAGAGAFLIAPVHAQVDTGLNAVGQTIKLPNNDPRVIAANLINVALGLLAIIMVVLILYAGFLYMTSGGEAEKTTKAKAIIRNAIIGLIIILSSWAIARFVIDRLLQATTSGGTVTGGTGPGYTGGFSGGSPGQVFVIQSITPQGDVPLRNVQVKILLSKAIDPSSAGAITVTEGGAPVGGTVDVSGSLATFTPSADCPAPNQTRKCFDANADFTVTVAKTLKSSGGQTVTCGGFALACTVDFHTGDLVDTQPPQVSVTFPTDGMSVPVNSLTQDVYADATDDSGISTVEGTADGNTQIGMDAPAGPPFTPFTAHLLWNTAGVTLGTHTLTASASDLDTNVTQSAGVNVVVRAEHCFNQKLDADKGETGIDCGGDPSSAEYCGACTGGTCSTNSQCSSGFCQSNVCVVKPIITQMSPNNGRPGTFVTLLGVNFGDTPGTVTFLGDPADPNDDRVAAPPSVCTAAGLSTWSATQAIVAVPDGAASGPIQIRNASSTLTDRTDDTDGPHLADFLANDVAHPGVCGIKPSSGYVNDEADVIGSGFGTAPSSVYFGSLSRVLSSFPSWTDTDVRIHVPVVDAGNYPVYVTTTAGISNPATYTVLNKTYGAAPVLTSIDPGQGPQQEYLTLSGSNFGYDLGTVVFTNDQSGVDAIGDTNFPPVCNAASFWRDASIVIKAPSTFPNNAQTPTGSYHVKVKRADGAVSNSLTFTITTGTPKPGICGIDPVSGPVGTAVKLYGDRFGLTPPTVSFSLNTLANVLSNTNNEVDTAVPNGAVTGPVTVKTGGQTSNAVDFTVRNCNEAPDICGPPSQFQCCPTGECRAVGQACGTAPLSAQYAWQMSTGLIPIAPRVVEECAPQSQPPVTPSPSPWLGRAGGDQAPIEADLKMRFSRPLDPSTVVRSAFHVSKCTDTGNDPCATTEDVSSAFNDPLLIHETPEQDVVTLGHYGGKTFATGTTYLVTVSTDVKAAGAGGANMEPVTACGTGPNGETYGYCYRFKTRDSADTANIGSVTLIPSMYEMSKSGETTPYLAEPTYANDACIILDCHQYDWSWYTGAPGQSDPRADLSNADEDSDGHVDCKQIGTGLAETGAAPVNMNVQLQNQPAPLVGTGKLSIHFIPPTIEQYGPNCDSACSNALIWARFSAALDPTSVLTPGNVELRKCHNENCFESELSPPLSQPGLSAKVELSTPPGTTNDTDRFISITPSSSLEPGAFYRVLLKGGPAVPNGLKGDNGVPMASLNHPQGYVWIFRVLTGPTATCTPERVDISPAKKVETRIDGRQLFTATPFTKGDVCSTDGQMLVPSNTTWATSDAQTADFYRIGGELVDTGGTLPQGCSGRCLATGASGLFGKVAVCGNGVIETTDKDFCVNGKTPTGKPCQLFAAGAKAGEECEPGLDGTVCDATTCLYKPVPAYGLGGTCGDGIVQKDQGEACDFGPTCLGGGNATTTTPVSDGTSCLTDAARAACTNAGGTCAMHDYRGCSSSCRHLGAPAGKSTCGNNDPLGDGKDCDDGNITNGDGCSAICLHEGSAPSSVVAGVCGNAILEPGETCERPSLNTPFPPGCDPTTCLHTGTVACAPGQTTACCGNNAIDRGEDCDDGNSISGDGCSASCLLEGSSAYYTDTSGKMQPSFCGNGILEKGEQCEQGIPSNDLAHAAHYDASPPPLGSALKAAYLLLDPLAQKGDKIVDRTQLAYIASTAVPDQQTGIASSTLSATMQGTQGDASYGLQCGYTDETQCPAGLGLDANGCCRERPKLVGNYPSGSGVCRNALISATFNVPMDTGATIGSFEVSQPSVNNVCPPGTQEILVRADDQGTGVLAWIRSVWHKILAWLQGQPVYAEKWCKGKVTGQLTPVTTPSGTKTFTYKLDQAFDPNTTYRVRFLGDPDLTDNQSIPQKLGVKTSYGVVHALETGQSGDLEWVFTTGGQVCAINDVTVTDQDPEHHPYLFVNANNQPEDRTFAAAAQSIQNNQAVPLSPVAGYSWKWDAWTSSEPSVVDATQDQGASAIFESAQKNGHAILTATLEVTTDTVSVPSTVGQAIAGIADVEVQVCENPWPTLNTSPFRDLLNSPNIPPGSEFYSTQSSKYFNFSTFYCRDAGAPHDPSDDLPQLQITMVPLSGIDIANGILRQYLFVYGADHPELKQDGIGVRIMSNFQHLSPLEWYRARGFSGSPESITVDGYPALKDGSTVYVAAANRPQGNQGPIYSNIYIISRNPDAQETTQGIYDQMVQSLVFNINKEFTDQSNSCRKNGVPILDPATQKYIHCEADWQCLAYDPESSCDSVKLKLTRDSLRIADFQEVAKDLENGKDGQSLYPQAKAGTYLTGLSTSNWPSWSQELGKALSAQLPTDPVNRFLTCGRCDQSQQPCAQNSDCPSYNGQAQTCRGGKDVSGTWTFDDHIDPQTCWNTTDKQFICPKIGNQQTGVSRFYQYRSLAAGTQYSLGAEYEIPPPNPADPTANWWAPPLPNGVYRCVTPSTYGQFCAGANGTGDDALCRPCPNPNVCKQCKNSPTFCSSDADCGGTSGSCQNIPVVSGSCRQFGGTFNYTNICKSGTYAEAGICGDGVLNAGEVCEIGQTQNVQCTTVNGEPGHRQQTCNACQSFSDDPQHPDCIPDVHCGNARVDKQCSGSKLGCLTDGDCASGETCQKAETCDDGALNGTYGHCNTSCNGYSGFCGDGKLSPGEVCDVGNDQTKTDFNGKYAGSCSLDCKGPGPYCGDGLISPPEECDGNTQANDGAICSAGSNLGQPCTTDADCGGSNAKCGGTGTTNSCVGVTVVVGGITRDTHHVRTCNAPGTTNACKWAGSGTGWSGCVAKGICGDGVQDSGEECDNGKDNGDTKACTTSCKKNICGDGKVNIGVEECDAGADNGKVTCSADYNSSCLSCSTSCKFLASAGGYCGNGIKEGPEQCDGNQPAGTFCSSGAKKGQPCASDAECGAGAKCLSVIHSTNPVPSGAPAGVAVAVQSNCTQSPCVQTSEPGISCTKLGYDYSINGLYPEIVGPKTPQTEAAIQAEDQRTQFYSAGYNCAPYQALTWYQYAMYRDCLGMTCQVTGQPGLGAESKLSFADPLPSANDFWKCVYEKGPQYGVSVDTSADIVACSAGCGFQNCAKCSDVPGKGVITGKIHDAVYANQPVPGARVTLLSKGVKVDETYTDNDGVFTFSTLNTNPACNSYKIVVDMYQDNTCTAVDNNGDRPSCDGTTWNNFVGNVDESLNGGYWPYTSDAFTVTTFHSQGIKNSDGYIYLLPRVAKNESLVVVTWNGDLQGNDINVHLGFPIYTDANGKKVAYGQFHTDVNPDYASPTNYDQDKSYDTYCVKKPTNSNVAGPPIDSDQVYSYSDCTGGQVIGNGCLGEVFWNHNGLRDLTKLPHARAYCYHSGDSCDVCTHLTTAPEVLKYSPPYFSGDLTVGLNDLKSAWSLKDYQDMSLRVQLVTFTSHQSFTPSCYDHTWIPFQQNGETGQVNILNTCVPKTQQTQYGIYDW